MADIVLQKSSINAGTSSYAIMYAQQIVDHFAKTLEENSCLVQFPIGLYVEFDNYANQLNDYIDAVIDYTDKGSDDTTNSNTEVSEDSRTTYDEVLKAAIKELNDKCFSCKIEKPKFDFSGMFSKLMFDAQISLDEWKNIAKYKKSNVCQYAFFLSYLCTPDLLKLIALILAAITRMMQNINLPRITISLFINGILAEIVKVLVKNISILARFALTPVLCILDAIESIIDTLPTPENIQKASGSDLKKLGVTGLDKYDTHLKEQVGKIRDQYTTRVNDAQSGLSKNAEEIFGPLKNTINTSVQSLQDSITELSGLLNHFQCEPSRSGISVSDFLSSASELMALANLLRFIIKFKAGKAAMDKLCNAPSSGSNYGNSNTTDAAEDLSVENIGSIIANAIASDIDIITDDTSGDPIAVVIKDNNGTNSDNLSFWSCNLSDFTDSISVQNIINQTVIDFPTVEDEEFSLGDWKVNIIPSSEYVPGDRPDTSLIPLNIDEVWNIPEHIKLIVSTIDTYNPTENNPTENSVTYIPTEIIDELINRTTGAEKTYAPAATTSSYKNIGTDDYDYLRRVPSSDITKDAFSGITEDKSSTNSSYSFRDLITPGSISEGSQTVINLECGSISAILEKLGEY